MTQYPPNGGYGGPNPNGPGQQPPSWNQGQNWNQPAPADPDEPTEWGAYTPPQQPQQPQQPVSNPYAAPPPYFPPSYPGGPGPNYGAPPPRSRKGLFIALGSGLAIVLVLVIVGAIALFSGSSTSSSASDMVQGYLDALARGDAEAALSYSADQPASKDLLTDEILKEQIDEMPITDIRILEDDAQNGIGMGTVHVTAKFGDRVSDATLSVKKVDGEWKLDSAVVRMDNSNSGGTVGASSTLTVFGQPVGDAVFYVFPGYIEWGTENENIEVASGDPLLLDTMGLGGYASMMSLKYDISSKGTEAIKSELKQELDRCARSTSMRPDGCPQYLIQYDALDGTVTWRAPSVDGVSITFSDYDMTARFDLQADFGYTVRIRSGGTESGTSTAFMYGDVDLTQDPLEITLK